MVLNKITLTFKSNRPTLLVLQHRKVLLKGEVEFFVPLVAPNGTAKLAASQILLCICIMHCIVPRVHELA